MRQTRMIRMAALLTCLFLLLPLCAGAQGLQDCHRVTMTHTFTIQKNNSTVDFWEIDTVLDSVDEEINGLACGMRDMYAPNLPKGQDRSANGSSLEVGIRYSRTGLTWMSFMVQARTVLKSKLTAQTFATRTYDMTTGERILLSDIFPAAGEGRALVLEAVRRQATAYFPSEEPDAAALDALCAPENFDQLDFTLYGMSLVIHVPAQKLYPERLTLIEVTLMYPDIRMYMSEKAQVETDNAAYYDMVALTFDDGPARPNTRLTLQALMQTGGRGTFFCVGSNMRKNEELLQRVHDYGHAVGSHNWNHNLPAQTHPRELRAMPGKVNAVMEQIVGIPVRYNRAPTGDWKPMAKAQVGWPLIQWTVDSSDWDGRSTNSIRDMVCDRVYDGAIALMHDVKDNTPAAVVKIVEELTEQGYMFLTIDELFAMDGVTLEPDTPYWGCFDGVTTIEK